MGDVYFAATTNPVTLDQGADEIVLLGLPVRTGDYIDVTASVSLAWTYLGSPNVLVEPGTYSAEVGAMSVTLRGPTPTAGLGGFGLSTQSVPRGERIRLVLRPTKKPTGEPWKVTAMGILRATGPLRQ